jgi:hypothetical protein
MSIYTELHPLQDYFKWFVIFEAANGDQYEAELMAEHEMDARREARNAFGPTRMALVLKHLATGHIALEIDLEDAKT